jgi:hypothetical protein
MLDAFSEWLNHTSMNALKAFVLMALAAFVIMLFSVVSCIMLLDNASAAAALNRDPAIRAAAQTTESAHHSSGKDVANLIFAFLTAAIVTNAVAVYGDRTTSKEKYEAIERGKASGAVAAAATANAVSQMNAEAQVTREFTAQAMSPPPPPPHAG